MLDATLSTEDQIRNVPLYMRANEIRQLSRGEYAAKKVTFSTSEFHTPHYAIGASEVYLHDVTHSSPQAWRWRWYSRHGTGHHRRRQRQL